MGELPLLRIFGALAPSGAPSQAATLAAFAARSEAAPRLVARDGSAVGVAQAAGHWIASDCGLTVALCGRPDLRALSQTPQATDDPAARLLVAFAAQGIDLLQRLHGSFALAVIDTANRSALLAIDRMGIEAMCFAATPDGFVFGSRADAVAEAAGRKPELDPQSVFDYLFFHVVPAPGSIFRGVSKLLPGQYLELRDGRQRLDFYWRMRYVDRAATPEAELAQRFRDLLPEAVSRQLDDGPVGTFLSGGTDSTTVTGTLARLRAEPVDAYSIGFDAPGFDEMQYARIAARRFGVRHHAYYVTPDDVVQAVPLIAGASDEPFGNASVVPAYFCARLARSEGIGVLLAGDGGDEIFGGNARYAKQKVFEAYRLVPKALRERLVEPLLLNLPGADRVAPIRKLRSYVRQARVPLPDRLETYNFLVREELGAMLEPDFVASVSPEHPFALMREVYGRAASASAVNRMMHLDLKLTLADNDLRKVNVACRLAGIDARYPMLDDAVVALSGEVPPAGKVASACPSASGCASTGRSTSSLPTPSRASAAAASCGAATSKRCSRTTAPPTPRTTA
ncbi:MAG: asparagine synthetase B [Burkholderiales bacterium]|nr:asparagine synthetase B [Burkholderiales bacterium]